MVSERINRNVREIIAETIGVDPVSLTDISCSGTPPEWDSLAHMEILTKLERDYPGLSSAMPDIGQAETVQELEVIVESFLARGN